jgi:aspartyl-tRNA(Asn)/glutamyl-tRNA(Gln) amidotransferase subunit C
MALSDDEVRHVARLARLSLSEEEVAEHRVQLSSILAYVEQLAELDLDDVAPAPYPFPMILPSREDQPGPTLSSADALANAPATEGRSFAVPKVIGS